MKFLKFTLLTTVVAVATAYTIHLLTKPRFPKRVRQLIKESRGIARLDHEGRRIGG